MVDDSQALGQAIQSARQRAKLTQQQLCQRAKLSYSTLAKIERGAIKTPSVFTVKRIAEVVGMSMDDLMGAVVDTAKRESKKTSKSGVSFLYLDINGCLVRFFHAAFTQLSHETGVPGDVIESLFWHYNDAVCRGEMSIDDFNTILAEKVDLESIDWTNYYIAAVEPIDGMIELVKWAIEHYKVGLLSNIMPGFIKIMIDMGKLPNVDYDVIIDSSEVGSIKPEETIYELAQARAETDAEKILFVDDSRTNLMAAERMGWKVMWFDSYRPEETIEKIRQTLEF